ncbi:MAG: PKD domain-containing protein, partial [candidate division Zixibacteria bacterium]|nr:PKD domain-containing protein [candidate division Zixibacteria bacterium]
PNGILYDGPGNRLLISSIAGGNHILAVDLDDSSHTIVATTGASGADGITRDNVDNYYYSLWSTNAVYRYDSAFSETAVLVSGGHSAPADIFFNKHLLELAVPNFNDNRLDRVPMLLHIDADVTCGNMPLLVQFEDLTELSVVEWIWDFGDGDSAYTQYPNHSYETSGSYDVGLTIITSGDDTLTRHAPNFISVLADSLWADDIVAYSDSALMVIIYAANDTNLNELIIPVEFSGELGLDPNSVTWSTLGCRTESFDLQQLHSNPEGREMTLRLTSTGVEEDLSPGTGPVLKITFELSGIAIGGQTTSIALDGYESYSPGFGTDCGQYGPTVVNGSITSAICCEGSRGNIDGDPGDNSDISDLVYLVDYMFSNGSPPPCFEEGDVNASGIIPIIDISDLVYLVDYMFNGGSVPVDCP